MANSAGFILASSAIFVTCSSVKFSAFSFSPSVIIATAFCNWASSSLVGLASIASSAEPLLSAKVCRICRPYWSSTQNASFSRYSASEIFFFVTVLSYPFFVWLLVFALSVVLFFYQRTLQSLAYPFRRR